MTRRGTGRARDQGIAGARGLPSLRHPHFVDGASVAAAALPGSAAKVSSGAGVSE
jgi:hypothetical protein